MILSVHHFLILFNPTNISIFYVIKFKLKKIHVNGCPNMNNLNTEYTIPSYDQKTGNLYFTLFIYKKNVLKSK